MSRRAATFTQADVMRALRAAEKILPGKMTVEIILSEYGSTLRIVPICGSQSVPIAPKKDWRL